MAAYSSMERMRTYNGIERHDSTENVHKFLRARERYSRYERVGIFSIPASLAKPPITIFPGAAPFQVLRLPFRTTILPWQTDGDILSLLCRLP